ncbi:protein FAR1-RELATED SEQUENCE 5-like [Bidens hawaiensis]|uniref:protein FAR1-RELATED SEQUENCE 5-like n=1 Tax=Bidens hawaiensis TaxID=980011 RepID=UPI0040497677
MTATVIIRLQKGKGQYGFVDPKDLLKLGERDIKTLSKFQIIADPIFEEAAKEYTRMAASIIRTDPSSDLVIPQVNASCKPEKGMVFEYVDHAYHFYCEYAKKAGFCVRKGGHNHEMVHANDMHFVRSNRKLTHVQQDIIYEMSTLNLGPVKAFNIMRTKYEGFEEVGATKDDCKNFKQSLTCYIGEYDAEMVVQRLSGKKKFCDGYSFEYKVNTNGELDRLFWAYDISKKNYLAFRDIISLDATFKTNKYNMVFVPFTVIDNHCRNVTVGVALLSSESIESYSWLLKVFLIHLVGVSLCNNENFKRKICDIVWTDAISQSEFETQWKLIMKEYDLETNKWLSDMFEMRLIDFFNHFDHCMEIQRHNGRKNDHDTMYKHPDPVSSNPFEKEAELIYTKAIFNDFQDEMFHIRSGVACLKSTEEEEEDCVRFSVFDFNAYVPGCLESV